MNAPESYELQGSYVKVLLLQLLEAELFQPVRDAHDHTCSIEKHAQLKRVRDRLRAEEKKLVDLCPSQLLCQIDQYLSSPYGRTLNNDLEMLGLPSFSTFFEHMLKAGRRKHPFDPAKN